MQLGQKKGITMRKKQPDPRDVEVGHRVRALRLEKGMSQGKLGDQLGVTFQQIQKYEKGTNRIGAGRLQRIAEIFNVPVSAFFANPGSKAPSDSLFELVDASAALRLLRAYSRISSPALKQALTTLAEEIAEQSPRRAS
jgi:transcriptional regulator with XRE-family HTH domain